MTRSRHTARTADRHELYEKSVQYPVPDLELLTRCQLSALQAVQIGDLRHDIADVSTRRGDIRCDRPQRVTRRDRHSGDGGGKLLGRTEHSSPD